ncbi:MAG: 1-acyl-sn-glycerol-3-phosphate acyltransferase, partial [Flavisolibacter sp.]
MKGPILLACNHPNSFLDGMILTTLFKHPVHSLARGDVFKNKWMSRILRSIQLLPVYRTSEGVENLEHNYTTFASCQETFRKNESVLIFSEGRCINEWHLRPLKKGTARLATTAWNNHTPLTVLPTALNYSSFKRFGKEVHIYFGEALDQNSIMQEPTEGRQLLGFNEALNDQLKEMVYEIEPDEREKRKKLFSIGLRPSFFLLFLPALAGWILHLPLYLPMLLVTNIRFRNSGHYDSVLTSLLLLSYPVYWLLLTFIAGSYGISWGIMMFVTLPLTAWCCVQAK